MSWFNKPQGHLNEAFRMLHEYQTLVKSMLETVAKRDECIKDLQTAYDAMASNAEYQRYALEEALFLLEMAAPNFIGSWDQTEWRDKAEKLLAEWKTA